MTTTYDKFLTDNIPNWKAESINDPLMAMMMLVYMDGLSFSLANAHYYLTDDQMLKFLDYIDLDFNPVEPMQPSTLVAVDGGVYSVAITSGGTVYGVDDVLPLTGGSGSGLSVRVTSVSGTVIDGVTVETPGSGYAASDALTDASGVGSDDATFTVSTVGSMATLIASFEAYRNRLLAGSSTQDGEFTKTAYAGLDTTMTANLAEFEPGAAQIPAIMKGIMLVMANGIAFNDVPLTNNAGAGSLSRITSRPVNEKLDYLKQCFANDTWEYISQSVVFSGYLDTLVGYRNQYEAINTTAESAY